MLQIRGCWALYQNTEGFSALNIFKTSSTLPLSNVVIWWMQQCILFYKGSYESERELSRDAALSLSLSLVCLCTMYYWPCSVNRLHSVFSHWLRSNDVGVCSVSSTNVCAVSEGWCQAVVTVIHSSSQAQSNMTSSIRSSPHIRSSLSPHQKLFILLF